MSYKLLLDYFPHFASESLPAMPEGFEDCSWYNDTSPNITRELGGDYSLRVWFEHSDLEQREFPDSDLCRYTLVQTDNRTLEFEVLCESDNWSDIAAFLDAHYSDQGELVSDETCRNGKPFAECTCC